MITRRPYSHTTTRRAHQHQDPQTPRHQPRRLKKKLRPDRLPGGKVVLVTRNLVAGHAVGGTYRGLPCQHFHDRVSVQYPAAIKVMSFERDNPKEWNGQTLLTSELTTSAYSVVNEALERIRDHLQSEVLA
jgi:hypothetical protein